MWQYKVPTPPNQCPYQISTSYTLRFPRYSPDKIFKLKVTTARSKVKSRSDHDVAHLHILTNVPTKYQLPIPYGFQDIARTRFSNSRSLRQGQRSNQGQTMGVAHLHILTRGATEQSTLAERGKFHENSIPILRVDYSCVHKYITTY